MTEGKPKLLWHSNAPHAPTGYGNQTGLFVPRLAEHYDLRVSSFYGVEGQAILYGDVPVLPGLGGTYGGESLPFHARHFFGDDPRGGMVVTLLDVWVLDPALCARFDMACWVPVDHEPAPPRVANFFHGSNAIPVAMSRFGEEQLANAGLEPLYVPHGVDTDVFKPTPTREARERLGLDQDQFLVGMVAANKGGYPSRKSFVEVLQAFAELRRGHDDAVLYMHTDMDGTYGHGVNIEAIAAALGLPDGSVRSPDPYVIHFQPFSGDTMALVYSAMDVLVNPSMGEGFGIPVLEAQACGTPVIVTDFSAMREVGKVGWQVEYTKWWTGQHAWQALPDVGDIVYALRECYQTSDAGRDTLSRMAREHAETYAVDRVLEEHMLPALEQAGERFEERKPVAPLKAVA